jgi:hypothetical protein
LESSKRNGFLSKRSLMKVNTCCCIVYADHP